MTGLIVCASVLADLVVAFPVMRWLYGTMRARSIDAHPSLDVDWFERVDRPFFMIGAAFVSLAWPVALPCIWASALVARWLASTPVKSRTELTAERDEQRQRIADLERALGIGERR